MGLKQLERGQRVTSAALGGAISAVIMASLQWFGGLPPPPPGMEVGLAVIITFLIGLVTPASGADKTPEQSRGTD